MIQYKILLSKLFNLILLILFTTCAVQASELAFSRNARTFESQHETLLVKALAYSCLAAEDIPDGILCNPAMTSKTTQGKLKAEGLISNGYSNLSKTKRLLSGEVDQGLIDDLFTNQPVLQAESFLDVMFTSKYINARYSPLDYKFFSVIRNDANPDVELFAVEQEDLTAQTGYSYEEFDFGLEVKTTQWKFIRQRFKLLSLATQQGMDAIKPKKQRTTFFQPGVNYNINWFLPIRLSAKIVNIGFIDEEYDEFKHPTESQFGLGFSIPVKYGKLDLLFDYKSLNYEESEGGKLHSGLLYKYGAMNLGFGLDSDGISAGVFYGLEQINSGIMFSTTKIPWRNDDFYSETVYVQVGWQL